MRLPVVRRHFDLYSNLCHLLNKSGRFRIQNWTVIGQRMVNNGRTVADSGPPRGQTNGTDWAPKRHGQTPQLRSAPPPVSLLTLAGCVAGSPAAGDARRGPRRRPVHVHADIHRVQCRQDSSQPAPTTAIPPRTSNRSPTHATPPASTRLAPVPVAGAEPRIRFPTNSRQWAQGPTPEMARSRTPGGRACWATPGSSAALS